MLTVLAALALAPGAAPHAEPCAAEQGCVTANAAQLFALADKLFEAGDTAGAAGVLEALTNDVHPELRAEARFRLAALREKTGDLAGAAQALRDLLAEQPDANPARLELARILAAMGKNKEARREIASAERAGLPPEVEQSVRRFASAIPSTKRRGLSLEISGGPDSNINRSTSAQYVDTIIAPFELDADARRQSGVGFALGGQAFTRNGLGGIDLLTRAGAHADLFTKPRFNDIQLTVDSGPEWAGKIGRIRPAALYERRWYGGHAYSTGFGASLNWLKQVGENSQLELNASEVRQDIQPNRNQDGWRTSLSADLLHQLAPDSTARLSVRFAALDARVKPESLRQLGAGLLLAKRLPTITAYVDFSYSRTRGIAPLFLFGKTRHDWRIDLTAGVILDKVRLGGFSPLIRVTHSDSQANIALYDYHRTRLDFGVSRSF
ncbi:MAG TPA: surface lipoprotein assembly modifier [Sphingomicrobium sp.]|nr:surface lipoprotein assembly modifier [Sphingomicrobium sp.]